MIELYDGKYKLEFNAGNHRYKVNGEYKQGATTILKLLDKGDVLGQWMVNEAIEAIKYGLSYEEAKYAWRTKRDTAGDVGKRVHSWIEAYTKGEELPVDDDMQEAVNAYLRWEADNDIKHLFSERLLYSEEFDYCGTVDDVHTQKGLRVVNDYKTGNPDFEYNPKTKQYSGKARPRIEHLLQDALYDQAIGEEDGVFADRYAVTYATKDGRLYYFETDRVETLRKTAQLVVQLNRLLKEENSNNHYKRIEQEKS